MEAIADFLVWLFLLLSGVLPFGLPRFCGLWNFPADSCEAATGRENWLSKPVTRLHDISSPISFSSWGIGWRPRPLTQSLEVSCLVLLREVPRLWMASGSVASSWGPAEPDGSWDWLELRSPPALQSTSLPPQVTPPHWGCCTNHTQRENDESAEKSRVMWSQGGGRRPENCLWSMFNSCQERGSEKNSWKASSNVDFVHLVALFALA